MSANKKVLDMNKDDKDDDSDSLMPTQIGVGYGTDGDAQRVLDKMKSKYGSSMSGHATSMQVLSGADDTLYLRLKAGERFVVLTKATGCIVVDGIITPGGYEVDGADFAEYGFPCGVVSVDQDHAHFFAEMSIETVTGILDSAEHSKTDSGKIIPVDVSKRVVH